MKKLSIYEITRKEASKAYANALRAAVKERKYRFTSDYVWKNSGEFFWNALNMLDWLKKGAKVRPYVKTIALDDILWDIYRMGSNKDERMSLRATGVFTSAGINIGETNKHGEFFFPMDEKDTFESLAKKTVAYLDEEATKFLDSISWDEKKYYELYIEKKPRANDDYDLEQLIARIALGRVEETLAIAKKIQADDPERSLKHGGCPTDVELLIQYCERLLVR